MMQNSLTCNRKHTEHKYTLILCMCSSKSISSNKNFFCSWNVRNTTNEWTNFSLKITKKNTAVAVHGRMKPYPLRWKQGVTIQAEIQMNILHEVSVSSRETWYCSHNLTAGPIPPYIFHIEGFHHGVHAAINPAASSRWTGPPYRGTFSFTWNSWENIFSLQILFNELSERSSDHTVCSYVSNVSQQTGSALYEDRPTVWELYVWLLLFTSLKKTIGECFCKHPLLICVKLKYKNVDSINEAQ